VVGSVNATQRLSHGQIVRVDGTKGEVTILS
jgi:phosphohistidine swiveling domain-containing protein